MKHELLAIDSEIDAFVSMNVDEESQHGDLLRELLTSVDARALTTDGIEQIGKVVLDFVPNSFSKMLSLIDEIGMNCSIREALPNVECLHQLIGVVAYAGLTEFCLTYLESKSLRAKTQGNSK